MKQKDEFIRMRKLIVRRHQSAGRKAKALSSRVAQFDVKEERDEMLKKEGELAGLCYVLKVLDKACQTEMTL